MQGRRRQRLPAAHAAEPGQPRLVLPHPPRRQLLGRERHGDAGVGELLQRPGRRGAGQHLLLDRRRADREDRLRLRAEPLLPRQRLAGRRPRGHAAGQPRQPGHLPARAHAWPTTRPRTPSTPAPATATAEGYECHWLRGTYDAAADRWDWKVIVSDHLELALQVRRHQLRRRAALLDQRRQRPRAVRPGHLPLRAGRHRPTRRSTRCCSTRRSNRAT